ncbi:hypothetical protein ACF061_02680 [Streptomyces sp. NPDC015220]|uniref:hypothetical protein n=1 Tax=Streptomyces sp. NPDC015220 TaxID=3364947 RepID=UPI0036FAB339
MENTTHTAAGPQPRSRKRTTADYLGLTALALFVLLSGLVVGGLGPLLAIACDTCQDGVRGPLRFYDALTAVDRVGVPLVTLGTVAGLFHPRGGARAGGIGLGLLAVLFCAMLALGQLTA